MKLEQTDAYAVGDFLLCQKTVWTLEKYEIINNIQRLKLKSDQEVRLDRNMAKWWVLDDLLGSALELLLFNIISNTKSRILRWTALMRNLFRKKWLATQLRTFSRSTTKITTITLTFHSLGSWSRIWIYHQSWEWACAKSHPYSSFWT